MGVFSWIRDRLRRLVQGEMLEDLADKELSKLTLGIMNDLLGSKSHIAMDDIEQGQLVGYVDGSVIPIATGGTCHQPTSEQMRTAFSRSPYS